MKRTQKVMAVVAVMAVWAGAFAAWGVAGVVAPGAQSQAVASTAPLSLDDAFAVIVLPNVYGFSERAGALVGKFAQQIDGPWIRAQIGGKVGDATLAGLPDGAGAVVVVFPDGLTVSFLEVSQAKLQPYTDAAKATGVLADATEGLMLMADREPGMMTAKKIAGQIKSQFLGQPRQPNLQATVFVKRLVAKYDALAQPMIQSATAGLGMAMAMQNQRRGPNQPGAPGVAPGAGPGAAAAPGQPAAPTPPAGPSPEAAQKMIRVLEGELRGVYSLAKQMDTLRLDVGFNDGGIQISEAVLPLAGTNLAAFAAAPVAPARDLDKMLPGGGSIRGVMSFNSAAYIDLLTKEVNAVFDQMSITGPEREAFVNMMKDSAVINGDLLAFDLIAPGQAMYNGAVVIKVKDAAAALANLETIEQRMKASGMTGFYESMGTPLKLTFTKNAREYNGVAIHRFAMDYQYANMPPQQAEMMKRMVGDMSYSLAFVGDTLVGSLGTQPLDPMIDAVKAGGYAGAKPLASVAAFGPGQQLYLDLGLSSFAELAYVAAAQATRSGQPNPLQNVYDTLKVSEPIIMAGSIDKGIMRAQASVPVGLIDKVAQVVESFKAAAQARAQMGGGPGAGRRAGGPGGPGGPSPRSPRGF